MRILVGLSCILLVVTVASLVTGWKFLSSMATSHSALVSEATIQESLRNETSDAQSMAFAMKAVIENANTPINAQAPMNALAPAATNRQPTSEPAAAPPQLMAEQKIDQMPLTTEAEQAVARALRGSETAERLRRFIIGANHMHEIPEYGALQQQYLSQFKENPDATATEAVSALQTLNGPDFENERASLRFVVAQLPGQESVQTKIIQETADTMQAFSFTLESVANTQDPEARERLIQAFSNIHPGMQEQLRSQLGERTNAH